VFQYGEGGDRLVAFERAEVLRAAADLLVEGDCRPPTTDRAAAALVGGLSRHRIAR
jgi:hypothetical protein